MIIRHVFYERESENSRLTTLACLKLDYRYMFNHLDENIYLS